MPSDAIGGSGFASLMLLDVEIIVSSV